MWIGALEGLSFWLAYIALYQHVIEGNEEIQKGISSHFDDFTAGCSMLSPQQSARLRHSPHLNRLKNQLEASRLKELRAYFNQHPSAYL